METNGLVRERAPYIYDRGLVRNYSKAIANDTDMRHVVTVSELESIILKSKMVALVHETAK